MASFHRPLPAQLPSRRSFSLLLIAASACSSGDDGSQATTAAGEVMSDDETVLDDDALATTEPGDEAANADSNANSSDSDTNSNSETTMMDLPLSPSEPANGDGEGNGQNAEAPDAEETSMGEVDEVPEQAACPAELTAANKVTVEAAITELFVQGDITAVDRYWGEPYLQHNPIAASGVATFRAIFSELISPNEPIYELSRVVGDCELVVIHGDYLSFGGATFDMFRVEEGRIVEHWDAVSPGEGRNASGHTALDGAVEIVDTELSASNERLVLQFAEEVLIGGDHGQVGNYVSDLFVEHSAEGRDGLIPYATRLEQFDITYSRVHYSIGEGNFVFLLSEGSVQGIDVAHYDLFRVQDGVLVEHWDGRREVPASTASGLGIF